MKQSEISKAAIEQGVPKTTVDKDWVLGHLLHACYQSDELRDLLIFKGSQSLLFEKCRIKQIPFNDVTRFVNPEKQQINEQHWNNALKHQISPQKLPVYQDAYRTVSEFIRNLLDYKEDHTV